MADGVLAYYGPKANGSFWPILRAMSHIKHCQCSSADLCATISTFNVTLMAPAERRGTRVAVMIAKIWLIAHFREEQAMSLGYLFNRKPITVTQTDPLTTAARLMQEENVGCVVVVLHYHPVGIVTDRDLAMATCLQKASPKATVSSVMTAPVATIREDKGVLDATQRMMEHKVRRLPIVDENDHLVGLVSIDDLLPLVSRELSNMVESIHAAAAI